jgi:hypothetical protein
LIDRKLLFYVVFWGAIHSPIDPLSLYHRSYTGQVYPHHLQSAKTMTLTLQQERILAIVPKCTASLGMPAAVILIIEIIADHKKGKGNPILRAIGLMALFELLDAFGWFLSTWAVPEGSFALAAGSQASCSFQGFLLQFIIGAPLCNLALALYFFLVLQYDKCAEDLVKHERCLHSVIVMYATVTSLLLLALGQYNHIGAVCWVNGSPAGCDNSAFVPGEEACDRGNWAWVYGMVLFYIPLWLCIVGVLILNVVNYHRLLDNGEASWYATQSALYALAFFVTWAPSTTWSAMHWNSGGSFWVDLLAGICEPLAAFWNLLIFLRNRPKSRAKILNWLCCRPTCEGIESECEQEQAKIDNDKTIPC